ncbi:FecCD family ABC transporter permease [Cellulomonas hominis]|uniref:FecCD family ABC transporter permease n=1 Tax=Cellulomonas hominis TaxID=156981 RepID=UPI0020BE445E|nr:iron chelate uptake ABC transporter family permease subunit [Cellulomonas hominis]
MTTTTAPARTPAPGAAPRPQVARRRPVIRVNRRAVVVSAVALLAALVLAVVSIWVGDLGISPVELPAVLAGDGSKAQDWVLWSNRAPRIGVAIGAGAAFGIAGSIFQSVTRNPLGSPDVIGLGSGAAAGAAAATLVWPGLVPGPVGALVGAGVAVGLVLLGAGRGVKAPFRMVVVGIAIGAMALAFVQLALARATTEEAQVVAAWLNGSLLSRNAGHVLTIALALVVLVPCALALTRRLQLVEMGDDAATALGVHPGRTRSLAIAVGVALTAAAVSVCGPVSFIALTAPQIARRVTRSTGPGMVAAACTGSVLLVGADLLAQHAPWGVQYPVGVLTALLGGSYLAYLLVREWRKGTA